MDDGPLSLEGISKGYSRGRHWTRVLADVSLTVTNGDIVAVTGSRLQGKTTLLKIAAGMERADKGGVSLGAFSLTDPRASRRSKLLGSQFVWIDRDGPRLNLEASSSSACRSRSVGSGGDRLRERPQRHSDASVGGSALGDAGASFRTGSACSQLCTRVCR